MEKHDDTNNNKPFDTERTRMRGMTDIEVSQELEGRWNNGEFTSVELSADERNYIYAGISSRIFEKDKMAEARKLISQPRHDMKPGNFSRQYLMKKAAKYAAVILLPILLLSTLYFYHAAHTEINCTCTVSTSRGEMASVTLPDGTEVKINNVSTISYNPYNFAKGNREVALVGEAYFIVKSDPKHPFNVFTEDISVKVLGTSFNINVSDGSHQSVYLVKGAVELTTTNESVVMKPGQMATYNSKDGTLSVIEVRNSNVALSWLNKEIVFTAQPIQYVIHAIEQCYGVQFEQADIDNLPTDGFTGTLPTNDIQVVLDVIEEVYGIRFTLKNRKIILSK